MKSTCRYALILALLVALSIATAGCDEDPVDVPPPDQSSLLSGDLQSKCYSWPAQEFSPENAAALQAALTEGSKAVEFSLADLDGDIRQLSVLLESKPVLLILGAYT